MNGCYCADTALQTAVAEVLESLGLQPDPADVEARPSPARTSREQFERIGRSSYVLAEVRRRLPVSENDRRLLYRLVDAASRRLEDQRRPPPAAATLEPTEQDVSAYAAAGGGCVGTFAAFVAARRGIPLATVTINARQDVRPAPLTTNPDRGSPPRKPPPTTNPTRTVRSSRWSGKAVRT